MSVDVARLFARSAPTYEAWTQVHERVAARLMAFAAGAGVGPRRIVEIGCGTGVLTALAVERYPAAQLVVVDVAPAMVRATLARPACARRVMGVAADARTFAARCEFDLLLSSAALHWALPLQATFANLALLLRADGWMAVALMVDGTLAELRRARDAVSPGNAPRGRLPARAAVVEAAARAGFDVVSVEQETLRPTYESAADFLRSLHEQGLNGGAVSRGPRPLTRGELTRIAAFYEQEYGAGQGRVYASFEVLYLAARTRQKPDGGAR